MKTSYNLVLFKIDYESEMVITVLDSVFWFITKTVIIDQSNENRFLSYEFPWFVIGNLVDDKIVLGPRRKFNNNFLECPKLIGNQMHGFGSRIQNETGDRLIQYHKLDLNTLADEIVEVPFVLNDDRAISNLEVNILLLFLILNKFRLVNIAGLERNCIPSLVIKIIRYFNYIFMLSNCF
jgi:hypothetical protein